MASRFNLRVYGLIFSEGRVLVCDETIRGKPVTKFPGGGLEPGEGLKDGLRRELMEELALPVKELFHYYTTDFFVASAFDDSQVISVYYVVEPDPSAKLDRLLPQPGGDLDGIRWMPLSSISEDDFSLVIDRHVAAMLREGSASRLFAGNM